MNNKEIKEVEDYKYLGPFISSLKEFNIRKGMAWSACNDLHKVFSESEDLKLKIFRVSIEPILFYALWNLKAFEENWIETKLFLHPLFAEGKKHLMERSLHEATLF